MTTKKSITVAEVEALREQLRELPALHTEELVGDSKNNRQVIAEAIRQLQDRNYSLEQIAEILKGDRMDLTKKPLRNYLYGI